MNTWKTITATALGGALLLSVAPAAAAVTRPRPTDVPGAQSAVAPDGFQVYNDYASPERTFSSERIVVHYVVLGIDAPPLNDDDADKVPDYVENVGAAADRALAYYERRGFLAPLADEGGPDSRPDIYVSRFSPGTLGVAFPAAAAADGAFAVVGNNLDPSAGRSFASVYATVAHELFHLVQFSYFGAAEPRCIREHLNGNCNFREPLDSQSVTAQLRRAPLANQHRDGVTRTREMRAENRADRAGAENREFSAGGSHGSSEDSTIRALHGRRCRDCIGLPVGQALA